LLRQDLAIWEGDLGALVVPTSHMINMQLHMARKKKEEKKTYNIRCWMLDRAKISRGHYNKGGTAIPNSID